MKQLKLYKTCSRSIFYLSLCTLMSAYGDTEFQWKNHNRSIGLYGSLQQSYYQENDFSGHTTSGILNTEDNRSGRPAEGLAFHARWQGDLGILPIWTNLESDWQQGQTNYDGYLQKSNGTLVPFQSLTNNTWRNSSIQIGIPFSLSENTQWIPHVTWMQRKWNRKLVNYSESYSHDPIGFGMRVQWALTPRSILEIGATQLKSSIIKISSPQNNFSSEKTSNSEHIFHIGLGWEISPHWMVQTQFKKLNTTDNISPQVNGLRSPPSEQTQKQYQLGLVWKY